MIEDRQPATIPVGDALALWGLAAQSRIELINRAENLTYRIDATDGRQFALRVHRPNYHSQRAIESELAWTRALRASATLDSPRAISGINGRDVQMGAAGRFMTLFEFLPGAAPDAQGSLGTLFRTLGRIAARAHRHVEGWSPPCGFVRPAWNVDTILGVDAMWGDWRSAPSLSAPASRLLEAAEAKLRRRLAAFGQRADRYGLIHADMRLANLLIDKRMIRIIDFDDCGTGWFPYDFAASISFMELDPRVADCRAAWLAGYRTLRPMPAEAEREIDTLVMLRRLALLAWVASHQDATEARALAPDFAEGTARLAHAYVTHES